MAAIGVVTVGGERFELVRYTDCAGRVYHLPTEQIVVENAHHATDAAALMRYITEWLHDPQHKTIELG